MAKKKSSIAKVAEKVSGKKFKEDVKLRLLMEDIKRKVC